MPDADATSEPVFVPRPAEAPEGDGWILAIVYAQEARSDLLMLNATNFSVGPIATAVMPHRLPKDVHGNWIDEPFSSEFAQFHL
nr:carotenoid oxygenase family protein [Caballeronia pedi]